MRRYDDDSKSAVSHKSTQSSRSSVLERAREYNRRIDERAQSQERASTPQRASPANRSQSAGRNKVSTHERAMASVRNDYGPPRQQQQRVVEQPQRMSEQPRMEQPPKQQPREQQPKPKQQQQDQQEAVVSPELLVDALSGHEDGLLAIAEKLMEHYDAGYDVMGEAIIDAFADVQKLFQHVVEAAHMEGAAFEASRREAESAEQQHNTTNAPDAMLAAPDTPTGAPSRHDEFIDEDVKELLSQAIRTGAPLREQNQHLECFKMYEAACVNASSLLPVDSDHRGRLQLSIARAESMSEDRACAILRYAMDDVLRSGLRATKLPDPSKRSDMVLSRPKDLPSLTGTGQVVLQSSEEALASLVEEMKEIISAPVYENTPLQDVAKRFWVALNESKKSHAKNEERLEQSLGKLKGEFLLARAEWEEKLTSTQEQADHYKRKFMLVKESTTKGDVYMEQARTLSSKWKMEKRDAEEDSNNMSINSSRSVGPTGSVASIGSGLAQSARTIVGSFNCTGPNGQSGPLVASELNGSDRQFVNSNAFPTPTYNNTSSGNNDDSRLRRGRSSTRREVPAGSNNRLDF